MVTFLKMHGLGNDFVIFDARTFPVPVDAASARAIASNTMSQAETEIAWLMPET